MSDPFANIERYLDHRGPGFVEAHVRLIDALRDYLTANDELVDDFVFEGQWTPDDVKKYERGMQPFRLLLQQLETETVDDGTLYELFKGRL